MSEYSHNLQAYPRVFRGIYGMSQGNSGLAFLGLGLGVILSGPTAGLMTKMYLRRKSERGGIPMPEDRLPYAVAAGIITPISMFWFAWSGQEHVHWIVPILAGIPFGWSMLTLFISQFTYLADSYANVAASCFASVFFLRSLFTCAFPLFTPAMYDNLGAQWAGSVLGFLTLACAPIPLLFYKFGPQIRKRSKRTAKGIVDNADR